MSPNLWPLEAAAPPPLLLPPFLLLSVPLPSRFLARSCCHTLPEHEWLKTTGIDSYSSGGQRSKEPLVFLFLFSLPCPLLPTSPPPCTSPTSVWNPWPLSALCSWSWELGILAGLCSDPWGSLRLVRNGPQTSRPRGSRQSRQQRGRSPRAKGPDVPRISVVLVSLCQNPSLSPHHQSRSLTRPGDFPTGHWRLILEPRTGLNLKPCGITRKNKAWSQLTEKHRLRGAPPSQNKKADQRERL